MTLAEQLAEAQELKALILQGLKDDISSGSLLGYTTSGTKVVYEGSTRTYALKKQLDSDIAYLSSLIANNIKLQSC